MRDCLLFGVAVAATTTPATPLHHHQHAHQQRQLAPPPPSTHLERAHSRAAFMAHRIDSEPPGGEVRVCLPERSLLVWCRLARDLLRERMRARARCLSYARARCVRARACSSFACACVRACTTSHPPEVMAPHTCGFAAPPAPSMCAVMDTTSASIWRTEGKMSACSGFAKANSAYTCRSSSERREARGTGQRGRALQHGMSTAARRSAAHRRALGTRCSPVQALAEQRTCAAARRGSERAEAQRAMRA